MSAWLNHLWRTLSLLALSAVASFGEPQVGPNKVDVAALLELGDYDRAEAAARLHLERLQAAASGNDIVVADGIDLLLQARLVNGRAADGEMLALAEKAVSLKEAQLGVAQPALIPSLINLGNSLVAAAKFPEGVNALERAAALCERQPTTETACAGEVLRHLGNGLGAAGRYDEGLVMLERSLAVTDVAGQNVSDHLAAVLEDLANLLQRKGNYERAGGLLRRAANVRQTAGATHPAYARTLHLLADQLWFEGHLLASQQASEQAVRVAEESLRADHPMHALALRGLAATLADLGDLSLSLELKQRALGMARRNFGPRHQVTAQYLHSLGLAERDLGNYAAARRYVQDALAIYESKYGATHEYVATALSVLALIDARLGDYARAAREQARAVEVHARVGGRNHPFVAIALTELATVYLERGEPLRALPLLERALAIRERNLGPQHRDVARTLADLAMTLTRLGRHTSAQPLAKRAVSIWERLDTPDAPEHATVLSLFAALQVTRGAWKEARTSYERALEIRSKAFGETHPLYAETQSALALVLAVSGDYIAAQTLAASAESNGRAHLRLLLNSLPERQALNYAAARPRGSNVLLSLAAMRPEVAPAAIDSAIRGRALVLDEIASRGVTRRDETGDSASLRAALLSSQQRLANLMVRGVGQLSPEQYATLLETTQEDAETAEAALADASAQYRAERRVVQAGLPEVLEALPPDSALVSFVRYDRVALRASEVAAAPAEATSMSRLTPSYLAFVLRRDRTPAVVSLASARTIEQLAAAWRHDIGEEALSAPSAGNDAVTSSSRASGVRLRREVWDPLVPLLEGVPRVFVVPDGTLSTVPFAALPVGAGSYLLETGPVIHYLSAERDLLFRQVTERNHGLLALGGASFGRHPETPKSSMLRGALVGCGDFGSVSFAPLDGTLREATDVSRLWTTTVQQDLEPARLLLGRDAAEKLFKDEAPHYRILHLATHGFFLDGACSPALSTTRGVGRLKAARTGNAIENPLRFSGLALTGANLRSMARPDEDDGILTAEEVATLDLHGVEWAVLSACDTGVGEIRAGEGVFGLRRAFQVAGARTVIMSLWSVDDQATRQWMRALYEGRFQRQLSTADAVHQASLTVLRDRRARKLSTHPFFWAAFVAAGDWR